MAKIKTVITTKCVLSDVQHGDVFQWLEDAGDYQKGNVMVVRNVTGVLSFVHPEKIKTSSSTEWVEHHLNTGALVYIGNVSNLTFAE